jgi:anti-anti-sigma factor
MAARTGQKLDANQELIGQGLANIIGSLGSSYPVSGSFSRTAVNMQAGGVTGMSNIFSALLVLLALLFFTPLLYHLPQAVLAAVIMMAVIGLVNIQGFVHAWKTQKYEGAIAVITFVATLYFAPHLDKGILIGVGLSGAAFLHRRMRPKVTTLAMGKDGVLQCAAAKRLQLCRHIAVVRFDGTLFFANASYLDEQIFKIRSANPSLAHILLVADGINDMDSSGEEALSLLKARLAAAGIGFSLCRVKEDVMALMHRSGLSEKIGANNIYPGEEAALEAIIPRIHAGKSGNGCRICPLVRHVPAEQDRTVPAAAYGAIARQIPDNRRTPSLKGMLDKVVSALAAST